MKCVTLFYPHSFQLGCPEKSTKGSGTSLSDNSMFSSVIRWGGILFPVCYHLVIMCSSAPWRGFWRPSPSGIVLMSQGRRLSGSCRTRRLGWVPWYLFSRVWKNSSKCDGLQQISINVSPSKYARTWKDVSVHGSHVMFPWLYFWIWVSPVAISRRSNKNPIEIWDLRKPPTPEHVAPTSDQARSGILRRSGGGNLLGSRMDSKAETKMFWTITRRGLAQILMLSH